MDKDVCPPHLCQKKDSNIITWIQCENCDQWYHVHCVNLTYDEVQSLDNWFCC